MYILSDPAFSCLVYRQTYICETWHMSKVISWHPCNNSKQLEIEKMPINTELLYYVDINK